MPRWLDRAQRGALLATALLFSAGYAVFGLVLLLGSVVAEGVVGRRLPWRRTAADVPVLAFLTIFLLSGWASAHRPMATISSGLAALVIFLAYGVPTRLLRRSGAFLRPLLWTWLAGGIAASAWAILLHRSTGDPAFTPALGQNAVGTTLLVVLVIGLGLAFSTPGPWRAAGAFGSLIAAVGLALTTARGAWLGAAVGGVVLLALLGRRGLRQVVQAAVLIVGVLAATLALVGPERPPLLQRLTTIADLAQNESRIAIAASAFHIARDHPVLGIGMNTFSLVYPAYRLPGDPDPTQAFAHNIFLNFAAEGGILGLLAFAAVVAAVLVAGWRWHVRATVPAAGVLSATVGATFLGLLVHQLFDGTALSVHLGAGMWMLMGILVSGDRSDPA